MTDTPLREASRERRREVWILYSIAGMIIEGFTQAMSIWKPFGGNPNGLAVKLADHMTKEYRDRWEREETDQ